MRRIRVAITYARQILQQVCTKNNIMYICTLYVYRVYIYPFIKEYKNKNVDMCVSSQCKVYKEILHKIVLL